MKNTKRAATFSASNSETSRRNFLKTSILTAIVFPATIACAKESSAKSIADGDANACIDYGRSFFCNTAEFNSVRMWIESRTIITDTRSGKSNVYYQGASCKSENTFGETDLF